MRVCRCTSLFLKKGSMARKEREWRPGTLELPTLCFRRRSSIQLSYGRTAKSERPPRHARAAED
jgi:hypothetical protein